jgi:MtfA peptidase
MWSWNPFSLEHRARRRGFRSNHFDALFFRVPALAALSAAQRLQLRNTTQAFLCSKKIRGAKGFSPDAGLRTKIATLAALPALYLGAQALAGLHDVLVYADSFKAERKRNVALAEGAAVVHEFVENLSGESWDHGPLIVSAADIDRGLANPQRHSQVVIHEIAHKIDALDGVANGCPPLHAWMSRETWQQTMRAAFDQLQNKIALGEHLEIDPYAATKPAEFFAVCSEMYWLMPQHLAKHFSQVFAQLDAFYRPQNPTL